MKKLTLILLALCLALSVLVACTPSGADTTAPDAPDVTGDPVNPDTPDAPGTQGGEDTNTPSAPETEKDTEDDSFISVSPADNDEKWGDLNVAP